MGQGDGHPTLNIYARLRVVCSHFIAKRLDMRFSVDSYSTPMMPSTDITKRRSEDVVVGKSAYNSSSSTSMPFEDTYMVNCFCETGPQCLQHPCHEYYQSLSMKVHR